MLRSQPKRQRLQAASLLASLSPQRGEGLRVRGGHIQNRLPFLLVSAPSGVPAEHLTLLRNTLCKCLILQHVTFAAKAPKMPVASPLASLSPQRGEGLRVRGGHIQSRLPSVSSCISPIRGPGLKRNMLKEHNMQVPVFTICYTAANVPNPAGHAERDQKTPEISLFTD
jgi:hypothetical protein